MTSKKPQVSIRSAVRSDVPAVLAMIKELAGFENAMHEVKATEEKLSSTITFAPSAFEPQPPNRVAHCFLLTLPPDPSTGAEDEPSILSPDGKEEIAGFALYFYSYSTWLAVPGIFLEDLFVRPKFRRQGLASMLLAKLAKETQKISNGQGRLEWNCLRWNEGALKFYHKIGGLRQEEWIGIRIEGLEKLQHLAQYIDGEA